MNISRSRSSPTHRRTPLRVDGECLLALFEVAVRALPACARASWHGGSDRSRGASRSRSATRRRCSGSHAPGHCSNAATSASCANSSASPTSRTMRARPAMMRADSMRHTASTVRWVSVAVTATDQSIVRSASATHDRTGDQETEEKSLLAISDPARALRAPVRAF